MTLRLTEIRRVAAIMSLAVAGAWVSTSWAVPGGPGGPGRGSEAQAWGGGPLLGGLLPRLLDRVDATPEQREQIKRILDANGAERLAQRETHRQLSDEALALFSQPTVDANAVEALRQKQLALHDAATKRMTAAMLEISRVLTPEQRKQMADYAAQRREMMRRHYRERQGIDAPKS